VSPNIIWPGRSTARNFENICSSLAEFNAAPSEAHNPVCAITFLASGVRDAAGHANVSITSAYLHVAVEDDAVGELFRF